MRAYTYVSPGTFAWMDKPKPVLQHPRDAIVRVTLASICTSDLHIKHGAVPRAVPGITLGHEMNIEEVGSSISAFTRRSGCRQCGDLLRGLLLLPPRVCEQLYRSQRRLGPGLPDRWRSSRVCPGAVCRPRAHENPRWGVGSAGPFSPGTCWPPVSGPPGSPTLKPEDTVLLLGAAGLCGCVYPPVYLVKTAPRASLSVKSPPTPGFCSTALPAGYGHFPEEVLPLPYPIRSTGR